MTENFLESAKEKLADIAVNDLYKPFYDSAVAQSFKTLDNTVNLVTGLKLHDNKMYERLQTGYGSQEAKTALDWGLQTIAGGFGSAVPYLVAGKIIGSTSKLSGKLTGLGAKGCELAASLAIKGKEGETLGLGSKALGGALQFCDKSLGIAEKVSKLASNDKVQMTLAGGLLGGLRPIEKGSKETWYGNAIGEAVGLTAFTLGNARSRGLIGHATVGLVGSNLQHFVTGSISEGKLQSWEEFKGKFAENSLSGMGMNLLMPWAHKMMNKNSIEESFVQKQERAKSASEYGRAAGEWESPKAPSGIGEWTRRILIGKKSAIEESSTLASVVNEIKGTKVQASESGSYIDHQENRIYMERLKGASAKEKIEQLATYGEECKHRLLMQDKGIQNEFANFEKKMVQGESVPAQEYIDLRLEMERKAREVNKNIREELGDKVGAKQVVLDRQTILDQFTSELDLITNQPMTYRELYEREFAKFKETDGKYRPERDYSAVKIVGYIHRDKLKLEIQKTLAMEENAKTIFDRSYRLVNDMVKAVAERLDAHYNLNSQTMNAATPTIRSAMRLLSRYDAEIFQQKQTTFCREHEDISSKVQKTAIERMNTIEHGKVAAEKRQSYAKQREWQAIKRTANAHEQELILAGSESGVENIRIQTAQRAAKEGDSNRNPYSGESVLNETIYHDGSMSYIDRDGSKYFESSDNLINWLKKYGVSSPRLKVSLNGNHEFLLNDGTIEAVSEHDLSHQVTGWIRDASTLDHKKIGSFVQSFRLGEQVTLASDGTKVTEHIGSETIEEPSGKRMTTLYDIETDPLKDTASYGLSKTRSGGSERKTGILPEQKVFAQITDFPSGVRSIYAEGNYIATYGKDGELSLITDHKTSLSQERNGNQLWRDEDTGRMLYEYADGSHKLVTNNLMSGIAINGSIWTTLDQPVRLSNGLGIRSCGVQTDGQTHVVLTDSEGNISDHLLIKADGTVRRWRKK